MSFVMQADRATQEIAQCGGIWQPGIKRNSEAAVLILLLGPLRAASREHCTKLLVVTQANRASQELPSLGSREAQVWGLG